MIKLKQQPYCRCCGKPIAKHTTWHNVSGSGHAFKDGNPIVTLDDCRRLSNEQIVSVKYHYEHQEYRDLTPDSIYGKQFKRITSGHRSVYGYSSWDGESYKDAFFCGGPCVAAFAYLMARSGHCTNKYNDRVKKSPAA